MNKQEFEAKVTLWLTDFIAKKSNLQLVDVFHGKNISRLSHDILDTLPQSKLSDFICDVVALVRHKNDGYQLIFVNRFCRSVGLKDIGEMSIYAKLAKPAYAFIVSTHGHSNEINKILINADLSRPLFNYSHDKNIVLFVLSDEVKIESVLPVSSRSMFK